MAVVVAFGPTASRAGDMRLLVPAYFDPGTGGTEGQTDGWAQMTASAGKVGITAIFNPVGGPDTSADPSYAAALAGFESAGGTVVAYIDTLYGAAPVGAMEAQIETYLSQYPGLIDGFFVDEMSVSAAALPYYQQLYGFVRALGPYQVIGNPGTTTGQTYLAAADTLTTVEVNAATYPATAPPSWVYVHPAPTFSNIVSGETSAAGMAADVALAYVRNVGYVYITDQVMTASDGDLYDRLPSYWSEEVATVAAQTPEPGSIALTAIGFLAMAGATRLARLSPRRARAGAATRPCAPRLLRDSAWTGS
ncbi:spherulation-specific family 4 protein [Roseiarcus fermentans]|uniref:spherulation-specific family 4 protein n=1 Tax=Roseiarcus fermentans TaxID=1473586 RepID=UPI001AECC86F|nr:spherulation-specific family 4 protein [Roseiarcus fermentans]